jgi:hypothetical protein
MRAFLALLPFLVLAAPSAHAQLIESGTGGLEYIAPAQEEEAVVTEAAAEPTYDVEWFDVAKMIDQYRISEKASDLRGVTTDAAGKNVGFYFASGQKGTYSVYRNGRRMASGTTESLVDLQEPAVFRMTASGDLLFAVRGKELYVNNKNVSSGVFQFSNATSVHEHGGVLTFPEGGNVVTYDIAKDRKITLYKHAGAIQYLRRAGGTIAYTVLERGFTRMYRDGRRVSVKGVENPKNFAVSATGDVFFFTKAARGYSLYRNNRSMVTGPGAGAYVDIDRKGRVWHLSYVRSAGGTVVRLHRDRSTANLLPEGVANVELLLGYPDDGYAVRAAFDDDTQSFYVVRDGDVIGGKFTFDFPYADTHGFLPVEGGSIAYRAYDGQRWGAYVDGEKLAHATLRNARFIRTDGDRVTVYATK